ncbi:UNVERIFIED_ORG: DNA recombination-dependent growth factor C [Xanthobacter viscosus]|uniref:Heme exporter protein D n=1 Tax=Xanthobacter autotrophicus TaxID=280 RepID=A0A6C1KHW9_XANAU|nr:hypothetical protein [Xanthobacter autotrophicus]TLX43879.1 hypothetical protein FBQ73_07205 [Xanthobacter autotrophicus]
MSIVVPYWVAGAFVAVWIMTLISLVCLLTGWVRELRVATSATLRVAAELRAELEASGSKMRKSSKC